MNLPFVHRPPTDKEIERLRLILSTYQDGSGMLRINDTHTLPGWRDFERACALTFNGLAVENKFFVDVIFPLSVNPPIFYGIDCKMRGELRAAENKGIIYVEVTNAAKLLWNHLYLRGVTEANFRENPELAGNSLIEAVEILKKSSSSIYSGGLIDIERSYYLVLLWDQSGYYQLFQLPLTLPNPGNLNWTCYVSKKTNGSETTRLVGENNKEYCMSGMGSQEGNLNFIQKFIRQYGNLKNSN